MGKRLKKYQKKLRKLDNRSLIVGAVGASIIVFLIVMSTNSLRGWHRNQTDHEQPLVVTNLHYCSGEKLDLIVPQSSQPVPLVVYIHGGGWRYGSKVGGSLDMFTPLLKEGVAVASINYRLSGSKKFPAQPQDILCAVRFLKSQAKIFNINTEKIGLAGISAGAHLAALSANSPGETSFISQDYSEVSNRVEAVALINGIFDLNNDKLTSDTQSNVKSLLSDYSISSRRLASPITSLNDKSPAQLIIYSSSDQLVSPNQSLNYHEKAEQVNASSQMLEVGSADHNLNTRWNIASRPSKKTIQLTIKNFFLNRFR